MKLSFKNRQRIGHTFKGILLFLFIFSAAFSRIPGLIEPKTAEAVVASGDGMSIYGESTVTTPRMRQWLGGVWYTESSLNAAAATIRHVTVKASPTRDEMIAGIQTTGGTLYIQRWNGTTWSDAWNVTVGDGNLPRFDIAYEKVSGDVMVAYGTNVADEIKYNIYNGSTWGGVQSYTPAQTSGTIQGLILTGVGGSSNDIGMAWGDSNLDLSADYWDGTNNVWKGEPGAALSTGVDTLAAAASLTGWSFDMEFEGTSGDMLVAWGNAAGTDILYRTRAAGANGAWSGANATVANIAEQSDDLELSADPNSNNIILVHTGADSGNDAEAMVWDGSAFPTGALDTALPCPTTTVCGFDNATGPTGAGTTGNSAGWLTDGANNRGVIVYDDAAVGVDWIVWDSTNGWTVQTDCTTECNSQPAGTDDKLLRIRHNPNNSAELMLVGVDSASDLWAKKLTLSGTTLAWSSAEPSNATLEATMSSITGFAADFAFNRYLTPPGSCSSTGSTSWGSGSTWTGTCTGNSGVPSRIDNVTILNGHNVTKDSGTSAEANNLTINNGGTLTITSTGSLEVSGNFVNNGTVTGTASMLLKGSGTTIDGTGSMTGLTGALTLTNNKTINSTANLTVGSSTSAANISANTTITNNGIFGFGGTGAVNGGHATTTIWNNAASTSVLNIKSDTTTFLATGVLTATATGNTVNYNGGTQTVKATTYVNLTVSGTGAKTFATASTVNGVYSIENGTNANTYTAAITYGASSTLQYNAGSSIRTAVVGEWPATFTGTGGVIIGGTGAVTMGAAKVLGNNTNVPLTMQSGSVLTPSTFTITLHGDYINNGGTWTAAATPVTIAGTTSAQNIGSFTTTGLVTFSKTAGTATATGNINGGAFTMTGLGGTFNLGAGFTHAFTGTFTRTNGTLDVNTSSLTLGGAMSGTVGTFTASSGTVIFNMAGAQVLPITTYNHLTLAGSGAKTLTSITTVSGNFTMQGSASTTTGALTTVGGNWSQIGTSAYTMNATTNLAITGSFSLGDGSAATFTSASTDTLSVGGTTTIATGATYSHASSGIVTLGDSSADDFTIDGTLSNTAAGTGKITAAGSVSGAGTINLGAAAQTFEQRISADETFMTTSGSNSWTFRNLTFSNSSGSTNYNLATNTGGSGSITVQTVLTLGGASDTRSTRLDPGNRLWILSGTGGVFVSDNAGSFMCGTGTCSTNTSTFRYTGNGNVTMGWSGNYYNLEVGVTHSTNIVYSVSGGGTLGTSNNFSIDSDSSADTLTVNSGFVNVGGLLSLTETNTGLPTLNSGTSSFIANRISIAANTTLTTNTANVTVHGTGTAFFNAGTFTYTGNLYFDASTGASSDLLVFDGQGKTYGNVWFARGADTGSIEILGANTFTDFKDTGTAAHSLLFDDGVTQTMTTWTVSGTAGNLITINSSNGAGTGTTSTAVHTLSDASGTNNATYLNIQHSVAQGGATWNCTNCTNNNGVATAGSGWIFVVGTLYWVGGGADAFWSTAGNWSATNGGGGGAGIPDSNTDVFFTSADADPSTISANISIKTLDMTGYTGTLTINDAVLTISGNTFTLSSGMTLTNSGPGPGISFTSTTGTSGTPTQITIAGKTLGNTTFNGSGGYFQLNDNLTSSSAVTMSAGTILANATSILDVFSNLTIGMPILKNTGSDSTLTIKAFGAININQSISSTSNKLNLILQTNSSGGSLGYLNIAAAITTNGGALTIGGGSGTISAGSGYAVGNATQAIGVYINNVNVNAGGGNIIVNGQGYNTTTDNNHGVRVTGASGQLQTSGTGTIIISGLGKGTTNSASNYGVYVDTGGIISTVDGLLTINNTIGGGAGSGTANYGLYITGTNSTVKTTGTGNISITATGGNASGTGGTNYGVYCATVNCIQTTGGTPGIITVNGTGGSGSGSGADNYGVAVLTGYSITGASGTNVSITGIGGNSSGDNNHGVILYGASSSITTSGAGTMTVVGTGGGTGNSATTSGVEVNFGRISSAGGLLTVTGTGGGAGTGTNNFGVHVTNTSATIRNTGGNIIVNGIRGGGATASNYGVNIEIANGIQTITSGTIIINTDTILLNIANNINSVGALTIAPYNVATTVGVNGGTGTLGLTSAFLGYMTSTSLTIGSTAQTGTTTAAVYASWAKPITFAHNATGSINITGAQTNSSTFTFNGPASLSADITASALTISSGTFTPNAQTITLTGTGTVFSNAGTYTAGTSTIKLTNNSASLKTFSGGGGTYNNFWFAPSIGTGTLEILGSNTFNDFKDDGNTGHSILFAAGTTQILNTFTVVGPGGPDIITINSSNGSGSTSTSTHTITKSGGGIISSDYLNIQHSIATPANTWYAGANSTNNQGVSDAGSGWIFTVPPCLSLSTGTWNTAGRWACGRVPTTADVTTIAAGHTVTMDVASAVLGAITIDGILDTSGTHYALSGTTINISSTGTLTANASTITLSGTSGTLFTKHASGTFTAGGSTVTLSGAGSATVNSGAVTFNHLSSTNTGTKTLGGDVVVGGNLIVSGNFELGTSSITVTGTTTISMSGEDATTFSDNSATGTNIFNGLVTLTGGLNAWSTTNNPAFTFRGGLSVTMSQQLFTSGSGVYTFDTNAQTISGGAAAFTITNLSNNVTTGNGLTFSGAQPTVTTLTQGTNAVLTFSGTVPTITTLTATASPNTVQYTSTSTQTVKGTTYHHLSIAGAGLTATLGGNTVLNGNLTISPGTLQLSTFDFTVNGTTSIIQGGINSATLNDNSAAGTNIFVGTVTIDSGGVWATSNNPAFTFRGGFVNNSASGFTSGSGVYTFDTNTQTISGTQAFTITSLTNNISSGNGLTFSGAQPTVTTLTQGTSGVLTFSGTVPAITTLTATANPNTVQYTGTTQDVKATTYHHININSSGTASLAGTTIANGTITVTAGTLDTTTSDYALTSGKVDITSGGVLDIHNSTLTLTGTSSTVFTKTGTFTTASASTVKFTGDPVNSTVILTSNDAITFDTLELSPALTGTGTYVFGSSPLVVNGNFSVLPTAGTASKSLAVNLGATTTVLPTKILNIEPSGAGSPTATFSTTGSNHTLSTGYLNAGPSGAVFNGNSSVVNLTGTSGNLIGNDFGTITVNSATVNITGNGNAYIYYEPVTFGVLNISGAGIKSAGANGTGFTATNLTVGNGAILDSDAEAISGGGSGTLTVNSGGTILVDGATFSASYTSGYSTKNLDAGSTVNYSAGGAQTIDNTLSYSNLTISGSGTKSLAGTTTVASTTTILAGTLDTTGSNHALTTGKISIADSASAGLTANGSAVTLTGTSGTLITRGTAGVFTPGTSTVTVTGNGSAELNSGSLTFNNLVINATGEKRLQGDITANGTLTLTQGSLDDRNYNVTMANFSSSNTNTRTIEIGSGTWTLTGTGTVWDMATSTNATIDANGSGTIKLTDSSATGKTFAGGGKTYGNIWFAPDTGTGSYTISGNNTFNNFRDNGSVAHSILFTAGSTTSLNSWSVIGNPGQLISINSTTTGAHNLIKLGGGGVTSDYLSIQHSVATPAGIWFAGSNSTNNQSTETAGSGWIFNIIRIYFGGGGNAAEGSGAAGTAVITNNAVTSVTMTNGGGNYSSPPMVSFCNGGGTGATGTAVLTNGVVTSVTIGAGGSNYTTAPSVYFGSQCPVGGGGGGGGGGGAEGSGAAGTAIVTNNVVTSVTMTNGGSNYSSAPSVAFCAGGGSGATGTAVLEGGAVVSVTINAGGSNYSSVPSVYFGSSCPSGGGGGGGGGGDSGFRYRPSSLAFAYGAFDMIALLRYVFRI